MNENNEPRILITSKSHPEYDRIGSIVSDRVDYLIVDLGDGQVCQVANGEFKLIR